MPFKYKIDTLVWLFDEHGIHAVKIIAINYTAVKENGQIRENICYDIEFKDHPDHTEDYHIKESRLFATKAELINTL